MLVARVLQQLIRIGSLTLIDANGVRHETGGASGPRATIRLTDKALHRRLLLDPYLPSARAR